MLFLEFSPTRLAFGVLTFCSKGIGWCGSGGRFPRPVPLAPAAGSPGAGSRFPRRRPVLPDLAGSSPRRQLIAETFPHYEKNAFSNYSNQQMHEIVKELFGPSQLAINRIGNVCFEVLQECVDSLNCFGAFVSES